MLTTMRTAGSQAPGAQQRTVAVLTITQITQSQSPAQVLLLDFPHLPPENLPGLPTTTRSEELTVVSGGGMKEPTRLLFTSLEGRRWCSEAPREMSQCHGVCSEDQL